VGAQSVRHETGYSVFPDILRKRFQAVAFMTAAEVVDSGIIRQEDVDPLCRLAFHWGKGPFTLMNEVGLAAAVNLVTEKMEQSHQMEINFPVPALLLDQLKKGTPWNQ
jgi:3-hydroxyacyl-CoA dehydrogenase